METISVIICVYEGDSDTYFLEALNSLKINRQYINEVIISINGPISNLKNQIILDCSKNLKIKTINISENIGIAKGLNLAIRESTSKWLVRFDSDDICSENRFKFIKEAISKYGEDFDVMGTYIEEFTNNKSNIISKRVVPLNNQEIKKRLIFSNPMNHVSVFFKKSITYEIKDSFYPEIDGFEDYALWAKLLNSNYKFKNFPITTVLVRVGSEMLTRRGGVKYIFKEIAFRLYIIKFLNIKEVIINLIIMIFRVIAFSMPIKLKKFIYKIIRTNH